MSEYPPGPPKTHGPGEYGIDHNPGYDFMRLVWYLDEAANTCPEKATLPFAPYHLPILGILAACCAIEGYVNMIGMKLDRDWPDFDKGPVPIRDRIERLYELLGRQPEFGSGQLQRALQLFSVRVRLVHPRYHRATEQRSDHIPDVFDAAAAKYPIAKSKAIAEETIELLLSESGMDELMHHWRSRSYRGPGNEAS